MDQGHFDALTRSVGAGETRRALVRLLAAGALGGLVARLGLAETAEGKPKKHKAKKRRSQRERKAHGLLHAQEKGKRKGKGRGKGKGSKPHRNPPPPPPPLRPPCEAGLQRCPDGTCVAAEQCCPGEHRCLDGTCVAPDQCCSGEKRCPDRGSPTGFACVGATDCCEGEKPCAGGCIVREACCPDDPYPLCGQCDEVICLHGAYTCVTHCCANEKQCSGGQCVAKTECCPGERRCENGTCISMYDCCPGEHQCPDTICYPIGTCCLGEKLCADGECIAETACCPNEAPPVCPYCEVAVCEGGTWTCEFDASTCPPCPAGTVTCPGLRHTFSSLPCCWEPWYVPDYMGHPACFPGGVYLCDY